MYPRADSTRVLFTVLIIIGTPLAGFLVVEGGSSLVLLAEELAHGAVADDRMRYSAYDSLLGWVSRPGTYLANAYGPGNHIHINQRGFRGQDLAERPTGDRLRLLCSGDSFAFGYGVDDSETFCERLRLFDPGIEPANLGGPGYAIDQAYLLFKRDGLRLQPDVHLFTFIWDDFTRMQITSYFGFGKPVLTLEGGALRVRNVPVPRLPYTIPRVARWSRDAWAALHNLRSYALANGIRQRRAGPGGTQAPRDSATRDVVAAVFGELAALHRSRGIVLVFVHMAERWDNPTTHEWGPRAQGWRRRIRVMAETGGYLYLDLGERMKRLPPDSQAALFIPGDSHPSERGHAWIARELYAYLAQLPELADRLKPGAAAPGQRACGRRSDDIERLRSGSGH